LVKQIKHLRQLPDFQVFWLRFTSILAANSTMTSRGAPMHDEMLEMISALLRLLRMPPLALLPTASPVMTITPQSPVAASAANVPAPVFGGFFRFLLGGKSTTDTNHETDASSTGNVRDNDNGHGNGDGTARDSSVTSAMSVANGPKTHELVIGSYDATDQTWSGGIPPGSQDNDSVLLTLSWKTLVSVSPSLHANLKNRNPQLVSEILRHVEIVEARGASGVNNNASTGASKIKDVPVQHAPITVTTPVANKTRVAPSTPASSADVVQRDAGSNTPTSNVHKAPPSASVHPPRPVGVSTSPAGRIQVV
jgi:hypothetical protein